MILSSNKLLKAIFYHNKLKFIMIKRIKIRFLIMSQQIQSYNARLLRSKITSTFRSKSIFFCDTKF